MTRLRAGVTCVCARTSVTLKPGGAPITPGGSSAEYIRTPRSSGINPVKSARFPARSPSCSARPMMMDPLPDLRDLESKLGRKVPESLIRSFSGEPAVRGAETPAGAGDLKKLHGKLSFLRQQMANLRALDVKLMQQLLSINEGIESIRWVMEERGGGASRDSSLTGSLYSLSDSQEASHHGSCSDGLDGISVGSYLDTLGEDEPENDLSDSFNSAVKEDETLCKSPVRPRVENDEYYCFG